MARPIRRMELAILILISVLAATAAHPQTTATTPPLKEVVIATKVAPPFVIKSDTGEWTGMSIELWAKVAEKLGLHTTFREFDTVPEMLGAVADGRVEGAISAITVTSEREKTVDFTQPFYNSGLGIAIPVNRGIDWLQIVKNIFTVRFLEAITVLIAVAACVGSAIWFLERRHTDHFGGGARGLGTGLWWSASAMTQAAAADKAPTTLWGRAIGIGWMIASVILIASFTAGITSQLAAQRLAAQVRRSGDLASVRTGSVAGTHAIDYLRSEHIDVRSYPDAHAGLQAIKDRKLDAFVYDRPILAWNVRRDFNDDIEVLEQLFERENYAIALPLGSALRKPIDEVINDEIRAPWWRDLSISYLGRE